MDKLFKWRNSEISYTQFGDGEKTMIAFHGYGQTKEMFLDFQEVFGSATRLIAVDLPFHGKTQWKETESLDDQQLSDFIHDFLHSLKIDSPIGLIAYSIGGNYALGILPIIPEKIADVWLIAADGLKFKPGFWFVTQTWIGGQLFKGFVAFPQPAFAILWLLNKIGFYPDKLYQFFRLSIANRSQRKAIYYRWKSVASMVSNIDVVVDKINTFKIPVKLIFGRFDKIIPLKNAKRFHGKIDHSELIVLEEGHQLLNKRTMLKMKELC